MHAALRASSPSPLRAAGALLSRTDLAERYCISESWVFECLVRCRNTQTLCRRIREEGPKRLALRCQRPWLPSQGRFFRKKRVDVQQSYRRKMSIPVEPPSQENSRPIAVPFDRFRRQPIPLSQMLHKLADDHVRGMRWDHGNRQISMKTKPVSCFPSETNRCTPPRLLSAMRSRVRRPTLCCPVDFLQFHCAETVQSQQADDVNQVGSDGTGAFVACPTAQKVRQIRLALPEKRSTPMPEPRWSLFHQAFNHRWLTDLLLEHGPSSSLGCPCLIRAIILNIRIVSPPHGDSSVRPPSDTHTSASST